MRDFDYDVMQKKRNARGAFNRKRGSKSKKCSLPSDYLTAKQLKELNGKVNTYYMNKPMNWEHFKTASEQIQAEYIDHLVSEYNVGKSDIAKMFGICVQTLDARLKSLSLKSQFKTGSRKTHEQKAMWAAFVSGVSGNDEIVLGGDEENTKEDGALMEPDTVGFAMANPVSESDDVVREGDVCVAESPTEDNSDNSENDEPAYKMRMRKFTLTFDGVIDADAIANSIRSIAGRGARGVIEIKCEL